MPDAPHTRSTQVFETITVLLIIGIVARYIEAGSLIIPRT